MKDHAMHNQKLTLVKTLLISSVALGLVAGCAYRTAPVTTHYDMAGLRTDLMEENQLPNVSTPPREVVWLNAFRTYNAQADSAYYLEVKYLARAESGLLDIPYGETLTLVLDGRSLRLSGLGSLNRRKTDDALVEEQALYPVTREQLQRIALARKVEVQVKGNNGLVLREFDEENYRRFRLFVITYAG